MIEIKKNEFEVVFQGKNHEIDARILAETISNFNIIVNEINKELQPEQPLQLKVKTFDEGSFEILFAIFAEQTVRDTVFTILQKNNIEFAGTVISAISDLLSIKKFLRGEKPAEIENTKDNQTIIKNNSGEIKVINSKSGDIIFNNPVVNLTINNTFNALDGDKDVTGLKFVSELNEKQIEIPNSMFRKMSDNRLDSNEEIMQLIADGKRVIIKKNEPLSIFKIVFDEKNKWQFLTKLGHKISAIIKDHHFFERVKRNDIYFGFGDVMLVDLEITQEFNQIAKAYENKSYIITSINNIRHNGKQTKLEL
ncbi:hypothetical protein [Kaistella pullorum]|uniref:Uncharacterized protein n=1 Tax=Kaistella pullorum TaxID=2763074 RepID=A0ABR8WQQ8_9FLAO|nr:hypothetical protein [Kaistella pullorum]MBD8019026.1 hypothetical protein [Kaistella pullorum]